MRKLLTKDQARRIAANIAKLPGLSEPARVIQGGPKFLDPTCVVTRLRQ